MTTLIIPGLNGSGPDHWQSWWLATRRDAVLVAQRDWDNPARADWSAALVRAIEAHSGATLVAHSLGCALVAHVAATRPDLAIGGAVLVAPPDVDRPEWRSHAVGGFAPMPLSRLPFPSVVVASRDDAYASFERVAAFATAWGSELVDIGAKGHINTDSGFGPWPEGPRLADRLCRSGPAESYRADPPHDAERQIFTELLATGSGL